MAKDTKKVGDPTPGAVAAIDWSKYGETTGLEAVRQEDLGLPFLAIAQQMSPQLNKRDPKHIAGLEYGDVFNTMTQEIVYKQGGDPLIVLPCSYDSLWMEWKPRETGGGLVKAHRDENIMAASTRIEGPNGTPRDVLANGNLIVPTAYFFCVRISPDIDPPDKCVIGFSSTQLKKRKTWLNLALSRKIPGTNRPMPLFSHTYSISTDEETKNTNKWMGWVVALNAPVTDPVLGTLGAQIAQTSRSIMSRAIEAPKESDHEGEEAKY